ncbi:aldo/keto reductase [Kribbella hippodromi]|uniref:Aldo/keto reductase n=1 Tax=Kribbella hippodromi TaxID=434347 RepID=A0ABP4PJA6_9ACTN
MQYRTLGRTGIKVSPYALGAMMFGAVGNSDHGESIRIIHKALDAGINFIDTADMYSAGESEQIVGRALAGRRDRVVLATKSHLPMGDDPNQRGNSRRWIMTAVEDSLRRLGTDYIDLFQMHRPDPDTDIEETLSALTDLVRSGKVRTIGSSTMPASEIVEAQWVSERRGYERFRTEQPPYSILNRGIEREVLPMVQKYGLGALVWSPLAGGQLTGRIRKPHPAAPRHTESNVRHTEDQPRTERDPRRDESARRRTEDQPRTERDLRRTEVELPGTDPRRAEADLRGAGSDLRRAGRYKFMTDERRLEVVEELIPVAEAAGIKLTHLAMAFAIAHPAVTSAIIGPRTMEHLDDALAGLDVVLGDDILDTIDKLVPPGTDVGRLDMDYNTPPILDPTLRRRPLNTRSAA